MRQRKIINVISVVVSVRFAPGLITPLNVLCVILDFIGSIMVVGKNAQMVTGETNKITSANVNKYFHLILCSL